MKNFINSNSFIKTVYSSVAIIVFIIGMLFSYLIADLEDAPGVIFIGLAVCLTIASVIYGLGEIIIYLKKNNALLSELNNKLDKRYNDGE